MGSKPCGWWPSTLVSRAREQGFGIPTLLGASAGVIEWHWCNGQLPDKCEGAGIVGISIYCMDTCVCIQLYTCVLQYAVVHRTLAFIQRKYCQRRREIHCMYHHEMPSWGHCNILLVHARILVERGNSELANTHWHMYVYLYDHSWSTTWDTWLSAAFQI